MADDADPTTESLDDPGVERALTDHIRAVRLGHGANCSSIGSVVDTLFASAVVTGAIFAAVCAALAREKITVVGPGSKPSEPDEAGGGAEPEANDRPDV
jgi:hypothetical protein